VPWRNCLSRRKIEVEYWILPEGASVVGWEEKASSLSHGAVSTEYQLEDRVRELLLQAVQYVFSQTEVDVPIASYDQIVAILVAATTI
jgi:hypothetical protein